MPFDVFSAINMSLVAILSHKSILNGGQPYDIPDFRNEEERKPYENDTLSPYFLPDGTPPTIPCCSHPDHKPSEAQLAKFKELVIDN